MNIPSARRIAVVICILLLAGCGSGALSGPGESEGASKQSDETGTNNTNTGKAAGGDSGGDSGGGGGGGGGGSDKDKDKFKYGFNLPLGDKDQSDLLYEVHEPLMKHDCAGAQRALEEHWSAFSRPGAVLLYQSAIYACRGDLGQATSLYNRAVAFGWYMEKGQSNGCFAHRAVQSFILQKPVSSWECEAQMAKKTYANYNEPLDPRENSDDAFPDEEQSSVDKSSSTTESTSPPPTESTSPPPTESTSPPTESSDTVSSLGSG